MFTYLGSIPFLDIARMSSPALPPYLRGVELPVIFENALNLVGWELGKLTLSSLADVFQDSVYEFRLGRKNRQDVVWEGEC